MSRGDFMGWYRPAPKRPPPAHGIMAKKAGTTWWGQRWIEALEAMSFGYSNRLARGRTYARAGRTHDLVVQAGQVTARVTGSRRTPYKVTITLAKLSDATWGKAIGAMAEKAQFAAELLAGQMPAEIDAAFRAGGASLFPVREADLGTACSCPDWANPCKHVAATHYVLGQAFDRDPFLLFELRGRSKDQVLAALRAARAGEAAPAMGHRGSQPPAEAAIPKVKLGKLTAAAYDEPRAALPAVHLIFDAPSAGGAVLRQLGTPGAWSSDVPPVEMLAPIVHAAAAEARRLALAEPETGVAEPAAETAPKPAKRKRAKATLRRSAKAEGRGRQ